MIFTLRAWLWCLDAPWRFGTRTPALRVRENSGIDFCHWMFQIRKRKPLVCWGGGKEGSKCWQSEGCSGQVKWLSDFIGSQNLVVLSICSRQVLMFPCTNIQFWSLALSGMTETSSPSQPLELRTGSRSWRTTLRRWRRTSRLIVALANDSNSENKRETHNARSVGADNGKWNPIFQALVGFQRRKTSMSANVSKCQSMSAFIGRKKCPQEICGLIRFDTYLVTWGCQLIYQNTYHILISH